MNLRSELKRYGLTDQQMNVKAVSCMEDIILKKSDAVDQMAFDRLNEEVKKSADMLKKLEYTLAKNQEIMNCADNAVNEYAKYAESLKECAITNPNTRDALNLYTAILTTTKDIFGEEKLTEQVMIKLLETASYGIWRSIMGSKNGDDGNSDKSSAYTWRR